MCAKDIYNLLVFYRMTLWQRWDLFLYQGERDVLVSGGFICLVGTSERQKYEMKNPHFHNVFVLKKDQYTVCQAGCFGYVTMFCM